MTLQIYITASCCDPVKGQSRRDGFAAREPTNERSAERISAMTERRLAEGIPASLSLSRLPRASPCVPHVSRRVSPASSAGSARDAVTDVPNDVARRSPRRSRGPRQPRDSGTDPLPKSLTHVQRTHFTPCFPARRTAHHSLAAAGRGWEGGEGGELPPVLQSGAALCCRFSEVTRVTGSRQKFPLFLSLSLTFSLDVPCSIPSFVKRTATHLFPEWQWQTIISYIYVLYALRMRDTFST